MFALSDLVGAQHAAGAQVLGVDEGGALLVERAHLHGAHGLVIGPEVHREEHRSPEPDRRDAFNEAHEDAAGEHAEQADDGLLAAVLGVELGEVAGAREVRAEARLGRRARDAAQRAQHARGAERGHARGPRGQGGGQHVEDHGGVVEDVGEEPVALALGLDGLAQPVREQDRGQPPRRLLEDGQQHGRCS